MNLNELAKKVTEVEGGKENLTIAQVKEVLSSLGKVLAKLEITQVMNIVTKLVAKGDK